MSMRRPLVFLVIPLLVLGLVGCSKQSRIDRALGEAERQLAQGNYEAAEIGYYRVLRLAPRQPEAVRRLAVLFAEQGRWSMAAPLLARAINNAAQDLDVRRWAGTLYLVSSQWEDAREQAEFILERQPTNVEALFILAEASREPDQIEACMQRLEGLRESVGEHAAFHLAKANILLRTGELLQAEDEAGRGLDLDPESPVGHVLLGHIFAAQNLKDQAETAFQRGFELSSERSLRRLQWPLYLLQSGREEEAFELLKEMNLQNPRAVWILSPLARAALELDRLDDCEKWLDAALRLDSENMDAQSLQAQLRVARGDLDGAVETLERLAEEHPNSTRIIYQLALAYIATGNAPGAVASLERVLELSPDVVAPALMLSEIYLRQGDVSSAQFLLRSLAGRLPDDRRVQVLLGESYIVGGEPDDAARVYQALWSRNPQDASLAHRLGQVFLLQGKREEARELFERVVELAPDFLPAVSYLANLDVRDDDLDAAVKRLQAHVQKHPDSAASRFILGQTYVAAGDPDAAETEFKQVTQLAPQQPHGYVALARLYASQTNRLEEARAQLESLRAQAPGNPQALSMLATLAVGRDDFTAARDLYEELLQSEPQNLLALRSLALLYTTSLDEPDRAMELAARARRISPRDPWVADAYGWVRLRQGHDQEALKLLQEAAAGLPANAEVLYHLGMAYYQNGREEEARTALEESLRVGTNSAHRESAMERLQLLAVQPGDADEDTVAMLRAAVSERPADPVALRRLAEVYDSRGEHAKGVEVYELAHGMRSNSVPIILGLAQASARFPERTQAAMELARSARKLAPGDPAVARILGNLAFDLGDYTWALSLLEEAAGGHPRDPAVLHELALAYYSVGRLSDSARSIERALEGLPPAEAGSLMRFQQMLALQQNLQDADAGRRLAEEALQVDPQSVPAHMLLGMAAEDKAEPQAAAQQYRMVLEAYPQFLPAQKRLAILAAEHLGDDELAYRYGSQAREALPDDPELASALGKVLYRRGDYRYAVQLLQQALSRFPDRAEDLYCLGLAQVGLDLNDAAERTLGRALEVAPDHELAKEARAALGSR